MSGPEGLQTDTAHLCRPTQLGLWHYTPGADHLKLTPIFREVIMSLSNRHSATGPAGLSGGKLNDIISIIKVLKTPGAVLVHIAKSLSRITFKEATTY